MSPPHSPVLVGRDREIRALIAHLLLGRNTLLVGPRGIGKTRLMEEASVILGGGRKCIELTPVPLTGTVYDVLVYVRRVTPVGELLKELCTALIERGYLEVGGVRVAGPWPLARKMLIGLGSAGIQDAVLAALRGRKSLLFLDSLDRVAPAQIPFLERLVDVATVCSAVVGQKDGVQFRKLWGSFTRLDVGPLSTAASFELVERCMLEYGVPAAGMDALRRRIVAASAGNPVHLRAAVRQACCGGSVRGGDLRPARGGGAAEFFNMGPLYIFAAGFFTLYKIFSMGLDNREGYIFYSAIGFLVYFVFRVYRVFFLFRPERER